MAVFVTVHGYIRASSDILLVDVFQLAYFCGRFGFDRVFDI